VEVLLATMGSRPRTYDDALAQRRRLTAGPGSSMAGRVIAPRVQETRLAYQPTPDDLTTDAAERGPLPCGLL